VREVGVRSKIESVLLPAQLAGMNQRATCSVSAIKVAVPGTDNSKYSRPRIIGAPLDLPDGAYQLTFAGRALSIQRRKGVWIGIE
jgi:hypothetical protein